MAGKAEDFLDSAEGFLDAPEPAPTKADDFLESGRERDPAYLHYPKALGRGAMQTMGSIGAHIERKGVENLAGPAPVQTPSRDIQEAAADTDFASGENPFTVAMEGVSERTGRPVDQMVEESDIAQTSSARKAWDDKLAKETPEAKQRRVAIGKSLAGYGRAFSDKAQEYADDYFPADQQTQRKPFDERLSDDTTRAVLTAIIENAPNTAMSLGAAKIMGKLGKTGAYTGAAGSSYVMESGDIFQTGVKFLEKEYGGFENVPDHEFGRLIEVSQAHGLFNAGLDALMPGNIASAAARRQLADRAIQKLMSAKSAKEIGGSAIKNAFLELAPELVQEDSAIVGESRIGIEHTPRDIANRKLQAAIAGGGIGGVTGSASAVSDIRARNAEVIKAGGEQPKAEDFLDNVEDVLSGDARAAKPAGPAYLPPPRMIVTPEGEAVPESKYTPRTTEGMGLEEVAGAKQGRAPIPAEPTAPPVRYLPPPRTVVTPEGVAATEAQLDAARRAQSQRAQELGTAEVEGAVQGRAPLPEIEPSVDESVREPEDLIKVISRAGGLSRGEAQSQGIDPAVFTDQRSRQVFGRPLFPKQGGMTMDGLAEFLSQRGFLPEGQYSANEALDLVDRALRGEKIYSTYNAADAFEKQAEEREAELREQSRGQAGPVGLKYRADDLRSKITAVQRNRIKNILGDDAARLWEPKPDDFALSGYIKESPDVQDLTSSMYEGRRIMGDEAFEAFFERFSTQNAELDGDAFESKLTSAIRSHGDAQRPGDAEENRPGAGRVEETAQPRVSQERENFQASTPNQAGQEVTAPASADRSARQDRPETRRQDAEQRKSVSEMSPDELRRELLTDSLTGLPNRRAYEESTKKPVQVAIDLDSLKWINDEMGHESGDKALEALGQALRESGIEAYHISGDEFMVQGDDRAAIENGMTNIRSRLDNAVIHFEHPDGSTTTKTGVHFSYGIGATRNEADTALNTDKSNREASGRRAARGEAPGGVERRAKEQPDNQDRPAANQEVTPPEQTPDSRPVRAGIEPPSKEGVSLSASEKTEATPEPSPQADMFAPMVEAAKAMTKAAEDLTSAVKEIKNDKPADQSEVGTGTRNELSDADASPGSEVSSSPVDEAAHEAATSTQNDLPQPTEAQKESGTYKKGHVTISGLDIAIENPAGSKRRPEWPDLKSHYGYFKRTEGKDGDQVDVFVKPGTPDDYSGPVFVVDQTNKDGKFDEHKVMLGFDSGQAARAGYLENYTPGWTGLGAMRKFSLGEFKLWLKSGNTKKPAALQGKKLTSASKTFDDYLADREARAKSFGRNKIMEETRNALAGMTLGREFGESVESFYARRPDLKTKADAYQAFLNGEKASSTSDSSVDKSIADAEANGIVLSDADKSEIREAFAESGKLNAEADRIARRGSDPMGKGNAFPMGVGYTKMTKRKEQAIDRSVRMAGESTKITEKARNYEKRARAMLRGEGTESDLARKADIKAKSKRKLIEMLIGWKPGTKISTFTVERVNKDRDGYPASYTISGDGIVKGVMDKVNVVKDLFGGDVDEFRSIVDEVRAEKEKDVTTPDAELVKASVKARKAGDLFAEAEKIEVTDATDSSPAVAKPILARLADRHEQLGGKPRTLGYNTIPSRDGYEVVYKPYGSDGDKSGAGYYYVPRPDNNPVAKSAATESDKKPGSIFPEYDAHDEILDRLHKGDITPDEIKAHFQKLLDSKDAITAQLSALTKDKLLTMLGGMLAQRYKSEPKARIVDHVYDAMLNDMNLSNSVSYTIGAGNYQASLKKSVDGVTEADIKELAAKVAKQREDRAKTLANMAKAVKDPKTLDDFHTYLRFRTSDGKMTAKEARMSLTPEQRATYDNLSADKSRKERSAMEDLRKTDVRVAATTAEGQIVETKHTKSGIDLFVVKAAERVDRDVYNQWNATAKRLGGYYSSFRGAGAVPGFQFKTRENADAFLKFIGGNVEPAQEVAQARRDAFKDDRSQSAVERLNEMADKLEERADESLGQERKSNTARRARFAASAEAAAETNKALAATMRNIAKAIEDGKAKFLNRVRQKSQVEMLRAFVRRAQNDELRAKYPAYIDQEKHKGDSPTSETIDYAEFPKYTAFRSDLARLGRELEQIDGTKKLGAAILKVADDVTDTYLKFAKENLHRVSTFGRSDGKPAIFTSRADAEEAIKRSGYKGKAVVLPFKRNQNIIILSPSAAHEKGIWDGDQDKRITLTADAGAEIVAKVKAMGSRHRVSMPYIFENVAEDLARLKTMGLETPQEFRAALREFVGLRVATKAPDKIKEMERAMIGRRKDGLDFFPTPTNVAQDMIEAAGIEEGMAVLEPSAGMGHIAEQIRAAGVDPDVVEMSGDRRELLELKGFNVVGSDFMDMSPRDFTYGDTFRDKDGTEGVMRGLGGMGSNRVRLVVDGDERTARYADRDDLTGVRKNDSGSGYDRIIMNPPFSDRRDAEHVQHAYELLRPGGRLVALMGEGVFFGQDKKAVEFREWLEAKNGTSEKLEDGAFLDPSLPVNTGVSARMVVIDKAKESDSDAPQFSRESKPDTFYSQMERAIDRMMAPSEPAGQLRLKVSAWARKGEFKTEEYDWSGIDQWLAEQTGKVTKEQVIDFIRANQVSVKEVTLSEKEIFDSADDAIRYIGAQEDMTAEEVREEYGYKEDRDYISLANTLAAQDDNAEKRAGSTKFAQYQTPGGENYREVLLTLPQKQSPVTGRRAELTGMSGQDMTDADRREYDELLKADDAKLPATFKSSHFDEPNILAHIRFNERTDADGKRVLFIEEVQSDWHQAGRKKGYGKSTVPSGGANTADATSGDKVPDAPFKTTWPMLAMKRMIRHAAENGFDRIAWTTGEQQAARYDLSKQVSEINYRKESDGSFLLGLKDKNGNVLPNKSVKSDALEETVGKEIAQRMLNSEGSPIGNGLRKFSGIDLKVGGSGMKAFYDQMLPSMVNKYVKKWGGKVGGTRVSGDTVTAKFAVRAADGEVIHTAETEEAAKRWLEANKERNYAKGATLDTGGLGEFTHSIDITPAMRESVMQGQPLFAVNTTKGTGTGISLPNGIDENLKEKAAALEAAGQSAGTFRITAGKLLDAVLDGNLSKEAREELQPVKILQDLFGAPVALVSSEGKFQFNGVYYDGTIWISTDSSVSLPLVFGHELSHRMEADSPVAYNALLNAVRPMLRNLERYEALNSLEGYSDKYIQKEMLGDLLGDSFGDPSFWQQVAAHTSRQDFNKIITAIRMWIDRVIAKLRGLGSEKFVSDLEAARKIMAKAVANYADARKAGEKQDDAKFSRAGDQTNTPEFKKWFGDSKVVDENGKPLVVYHGTSADFTAFSKKAGFVHDDDGFFFTIDPKHASSYAGGRQGSKLLPVYLSIKNPLRMTSKEWYDNKKNGRELGDQTQWISEGYDGLFIENLQQQGGKSDTYVAFRPEQIKSAIGNRGTFDPNDPNILFSRKSAETTEPTTVKDVAPGLLSAYRTRARKVIDRIDRALDPMGNLPDSKAYLTKRYLALGRIAKGDEIAKVLGRAFSNATDADKQAVFDYLTTKDASPKAIQNEIARADAARAKNLIESVSDAMVSRGMLSEAARETHRGSYLPQLYLKWLLNDADVKSLGAGKKPSDMGYLKGRKIERTKGPDGEARFVWRDSGTPLSDAQVLDLGPISDPGFLAATAIAKPVRDMALLDFLSAISQNEKWILPNTLVDFEGVHSTPQFLKAEAERLRRQADHYGPEDAKTTRAMADRMDTVANKALGSLSGDFKNYREVPNTAKYGRLRGLWVRKEIYDDLVGAYDLSPDDPGFVQSLLGYGGIGTKITQLWKMGKVALNPPSQVRNFVSNGVLMQMSGVPLHKVPVYLGKAIRAITNNGPAWKIAKKYGVTESTFSTQELFRIKRDLLDLEMREGRLKPLGKLHRIGAIVADGASDAYQFSEALYKTAKIMHAMDNGATEVDAAIEAMKWLFDYSLVPKGVRYARNAPIGVPFLCVDEATEALTKEGWKGIDDIKEGDMVASFDMKSQHLEWKPVTWVYRDNYDGPMVHVKDRHLDMLLTPHHRCVTYRKRRVPGGRADNVVGLNLEIVAASDLNVADHIPVAAKFARKPEGESISDAMVKVLAWVATEGYLHPKCAQVRIYQNLGKSQPIRDALAEAGMTWSEFVTAKRVNGNDESVSFNVHAVHGRRIRELLPNKKLTPGLLNRLTNDQLDLLIETMIDGDGCRSSSQASFIQKKGETAEAFKMALVMAGRSFGVHDRGNGIEQITLRDGKRYCVKRALHSQVQYKGRIWCPEVPGFTTWVARRNGKVFITGNTFQYKVLPRLAEVALLHPQRLIPWVALFAGWPLLWAAMTGDDEDEYERLQKSLPQWLQERGHAMILPYTDEDGRSQVLDLGYFMPWSMYTDALGDMARGEIGETAQTLGIFSGPLTSVIVAMKTGKDSFTGRDIMNPGDPAGRQFAAAANYTWDMMMPPIVSSRGLFSPMGLVDAEYGGKLVSATTGRTNKFGEPTTTATQAALYPFGLNVYSIEPQHSTAQNVLRLKYEADQTEQAVKRKLQNRALSEEARREIVEEYTDEMNRRYQKIEEYKN